MKLMAWYKLPGTPAYLLATKISGKVVKGLAFHNNRIFTYTALVQDCKTEVDVPNDVFSNKIQLIDCLFNDIPIKEL